MFIHFFLQMTNVVPVQRRHNYVRLLTSSQLGHLFGHFLCNTPSNGKHYWNPKMKKSSTLCTDRRPVKPHRLRHQSPSPGWFEETDWSVCYQYIYTSGFSVPGKWHRPSLSLYPFFLGYGIWMIKLNFYWDTHGKSDYEYIKFSFKAVFQSIWFLLPIVRHSDDQV